VVYRWCPQKISAALLAAGVAALLGPGFAAAKTITVANTNDHGPGSLRQAIIDAAPGDTVAVPGGTYMLTTGELAIAKSLTIAGSGSASTVISNGATSRVFHTSGAANTIKISGVTIRNGRPAPVGNLADGGGVLNEAATLTLTDDLITDNQANANGAGPSGAGGIAEGGGVASTSGTLNVRDSQVVSNTATAIGNPSQAGGITSGGGILDEGTLTIESSTLSSNVADSVGGSAGNGGISQGGGLFADGQGATDVAATTFSGNLGDASAGAGGTIGGIAEGAGAFMLTNAPAMSAANITVAGNTARSTNGGIVSAGGLLFGSNAPVVTLTNATISANTATGSGDNHGGDASLGGATTHVKNTIVTAGTADAGFENCAGAPTSLGGNLDSRNQCHFTAATDQVNTDPLLGPLHDNGGPADTLSLLQGSPAIDAGTNSGCPDTDERGVLRPAGPACDIGAFEVATPAASTSSATAVAATGATLNGNAFNPALTAGTAHFEYGTTTAYGTTSSSQTIAATSRRAPVSASISGLAPHTLYHFRLVVTNSVGTARSDDRTFTTASSPPPPRRPRISGLKLVPRAFIAAARGGAIAARRTGTTVSYTESRPATTTFVVQRPAAGRRVGRACARPSRRNHAHKRCTRWIGVGRFTHRGRTRLIRFHFTGRVNGHKLRPGRYRLHAVPRSTAGAGPAANARFEVKKR
jgi:hypothetical protein